MESVGEFKQVARRGALAAAARWRLPFSRQAWRGLAGNWLGAGAGSSLDFQDHRNYVPGDDPRHIHWQAYARTGVLTMKLYRAEVAPFVDIVVDVSASMALSAAKATRTDELLAFCVECADRAGAPARVHAVEGRHLQTVAAEEVRAGRWRERLKPMPGEASPQTRDQGPKTKDLKPSRQNSTRSQHVSPAQDSGAASAPPASTRTEGPPAPPGPPGPLPWRAGALKVLISDLLYPGDPSSLLAPLAGGSGVSVLLAPALGEEADLPWRGNVELNDCESGALRRQRIDEALAQRYRAAYARHFALWREAARKRAVLFARVPCEPALTAALGGDAFAAGAVEAVA